jgi:GT2 family glycosyltransferase
VPQVLAAASPSNAPNLRPTARGKFLALGDAKFHVRGVTYGPFRPDANGCEYHAPERVRRDFSAMAEAGVNTVRLYTVPPRWLLDAALERGLRVMVGLPWEQHVTFLDDRGRAADIVRRVRDGARSCANHPALLAFDVGNEIPARIVRWHGHRKVERFIRQLYEAVKAEDAGAQVTYVNYPSTEYLYLPFLDFCCFNVYLESREGLEAYLARLQNLAGERPLVMAEVGLDGLRNGERHQGTTLAWQIEAVLAAGCAGLCVFAWTDEWHRGGHDIVDWQFGLTTVERKPKLALAAVRRAFEDTPFAMDRSWPGASVVVCTHNGARTIRETLDGLRRLEYPNYEVIVVDDGSTDDTARVVAEYADVRLIRTANRGLSAARNTGLAAAAGEIVAYIDDDAWPDEHWLMYLADAFARGDHAAVGGPNIAPPGDGLVAECVSRAPGGPTHVLLTDRVAEHIPGCNMAFRAERLRAVGGFDEQFRIAGDDVDVCWRLQERGWTLGYTAAAMVWHHRRPSVGRFWRQQFHYGAAEGRLRRKWPHRYTAGGRIMWSGRLYDQGGVRALGGVRRRIFHGMWGSALFQSVYQPAAFWSAVGLMPEWYLLIALAAAASAVGVAWPPLLPFALPVFTVALLVPLIQAVVAARRATFIEAQASPGQLRRARALTAFLYLTQPAARLLGRLREGPRLGRGRARRQFVWPWPRTTSIWHETWASCEQRLESLEKRLTAAGAVVRRGGAYDRWDLSVGGGLLGGARLRATVEEHGSGKQMARYRVWPRASTGAAVVVGFCAVASAVAGAWRAGAACGLAAAVGAVVAGWAVFACGVGMGAVEAAVRADETGTPSRD